MQFVCCNIGISPIMLLKIN